MWELSISVDSANGGCMAGLYDGLLPAVRTAGGVIIKDGGARPSVTLACEDDRKAPLIETVSDALSEVVVNNYKFKFLKKHSRILIDNPVWYNAFLTALVTFDREWDKQVVLRELFFGRELLLDGFYNFRLKELKDRWKEICALASENAAFLSNPDTFAELLRFLVTSADSRVDELTVLCPCHSERSEESQPVNEVTGNRYQVSGRGQTNTQNSPPERGVRGADVACGGFFELNLAGQPIDRAARGLPDKITDEALLPAIIHLSPKFLSVQKEGVPDEIINLIKSVYGANAELV